MLRIYRKKRHETLRLVVKSCKMWFSGESIYLYVYVDEYACVYGPSSFCGYVYVYVYVYLQPNSNVSVYVYVYVYVYYGYVYEFVCACLGLLFRTLSLWKAAVPSWTVVSSAPYSCPKHEHGLLKTPI